MGSGDAVDLLAIIFLLIGQSSEDGSKNHPGTVNPGQRLVNSNRPAGLRSFDSGRADREIGAGEIEIGGYRAEHHVHGAIGIAGVLASRADGSWDRGDR